MSTNKGHQHGAHPRNNQGHKPHDKPKQPSSGGGQQQQQQQPQQQHHQPQQQQQKPKKPTSQQPEQPQLTRKQIEEQQQQALLDQARKLDETIWKHDEEKRKKPQSLETSFSYVKVRSELQKVPDLSPHWVDTLFVPYLPQDNGPVTEHGPNGVPVDEEVIKYLNHDLSILLRKKYHLFWSEVVHNATLQKLIDTFLRFYQRNWDDSAEFLGSKDRQEARFQLCKRMFCLMLRMSSHQESSSDFMDKQFHANLIYDKKIFDVAKMMDICAIYGGKNGFKEHVQKLITNLFEIQPKFAKNVEDMVPTMVKALQDIGPRLSKAVDSLSTSSSSTPLSSSSSNSLSSSSTLRHVQDDISKFLMDICGTISHFLKAYEKAAPIFVKSDLLVTVAHCYEEVLPLLDRHLHTTDGRMAKIKRFMLSVGELLLNHGYLTPLVRAKDNVSGKLWDQVSAVLKELSGATKTKPGFKLSGDYLKDLNTKYQLHEVLSTVNSSVIDEAQLKYAILLLGGDTATIMAKKPAKAPEKKAVDGADAKRNTHIAQVRELFPDMQPEVISRCLAHYKDNVEELFHHLLENSVPKELLQIAPQAGGSVLSTRKNVYDNDQFDVFHRDNIDAAKVLLPKAQRVESKVAVLNDKSAMRAVTYDDEYDDSFDEFAQFSLTDSTEISELEDKVTLKPAEEPSTATTLADDDSSGEEDGGKPFHKPGPSTYAPRGRGRGTTSSYHRFKSHNKKDRALKKRGGFIPTQ